jgi:hypothetical protein
LPAWGGFSFIFVSSNLIVSYDTSHNSQTNAIVVGPSINRQPVSQAATTGDLAIFHATASGSQPLNYQWTKGGKNLINGGRISGVTTGTLRIRKVNRNDAGLYRLRVSNSAGTATSAGARLTVSRR